MKAKLSLLAKAIGSFFKKHTIAAVVSAVCLVLCIALTAGIIYIGSTGFIIKGEPQESIIEASGNATQSDSGVLPDVEIPQVEIADENSSEDFSGTVDSNDNSEETVDYTIAESFENIRSEKWESMSYGIDVSSHNGEIDWGKAAADGVEFAMIRCGYRGYVTGKIVQDTRFDYNIRSAAANGISIGIYFYSTAVNEKEAAEEAAWVCHKLYELEEEGIKIVYPVAYDFEEFYNKDKTRAVNVTKEQLTKNTTVFLNYVKLSGFTPMLYASKTAVAHYWNFSKIENYDFWLAHYVEQTDYSGEYAMWQFSCKGKVDGIKNNVDLNISYYRYTYPSEPVVIKGDTLEIKNAPSDNSVTDGILVKNVTYERTRTTVNGWSEIKYNGFIGYVKTQSVEKAEFKECDLTVSANAPSAAYYKAIADGEYKIRDISEGETFKAVKYFGGIWYETEIDGQRAYIQADKFSTLN